MYKNLSLQDVSGSQTLVGLGPCQPVREIGREEFWWLQSGKPLKWGISYGHALQRVILMGREPRLTPDISVKSLKLC